MTTLFRNVPPRLSLALAMTEKVEKAERKKLMEQHAISELDAAKIIAERLIQSPTGIGKNHENLSTAPIHRRNSADVFRLRYFCQSSCH